MKPWGRPTAAALSTGLCFGQPKISNNLLSNYFFYSNVQSMIASIWSQCFYVYETENIHLRKTMTKLQLKTSRRDRRVGLKLSNTMLKVGEEHKAEVETVFPSQQQPKTLEKPTNRHVKEIQAHYKPKRSFLSSSSRWRDDGGWPSDGGPRCPPRPRHMVPSPRSSWMMLNVNVSGDSVAVMQQKPSVSTSDPPTFQHSNADKPRKDFILSDVRRQMCLSTRRPSEGDNERRNKRQDTVDWITWQLRSGALNCADHWTTSGWDHVTEFLEYRQGLRVSNTTQRVPPHLTGLTPPAFRTTAPLMFVWLRQECQTPRKQFSKNRQLNHHWRILHCSHTDQLRQQTNWIFTQSRKKYFYCILENCDCVSSQLHLTVFVMVSKQQKKTQHQTQFRGQPVDTTTISNKFHKKVFSELHVDFGKPVEV